VELALEGARGTVAWSTCSISMLVPTASIAAAPADGGPQRRRDQHLGRTGLP
jgi:hypothetical protein